MTLRYAWLPLSLVLGGAFAGCLRQDGGGTGEGDPQVDPPATPSGTPFFLPTGAEVRNTVNPSIETDAAGNLHLVYPTYAIGDAFYAYCDAGCDSPDDMSVVKFPTQGTVLNAMLALGPDGKPQVLLSTGIAVYYASCSGDCRQPTGWQTSIIVQHQGDLEVTGEAFALTPDGRPRFMMHSYRALFGVGAPPPATHYVTCDSECHDPERWSHHLVATQIWQESTLRFTAGGEPRLATIATVETEGGKQDIGAYVECNGACTAESDWIGLGLYASYSDRNIELIEPAISMDLTGTGAPRVVMLGENESGARNLAYFECAGGCAEESGWNGQILVESDDLGAGLDLALDAADRPRFVYTADYNILLAHCDDGCTATDAPWKLTKVELSEEMKPDEVIPYADCTVAAWFLRYPSLALGSDGLPRVAYRAEDISGGGGTHHDPNKPQCAAGPDMTFARFARMRSLD